MSRRIVTFPSHPLAVAHFDLLMLETSTTTLIILFVKLVALKGVLHDGGEVASTRAQTQAWLLRALRKSWRTVRTGLVRGGVNGTHAFSTHGSKERNFK